MAKKTNPLAGLSKSEVAALIEDADFDPETEDNDGPLEIVVRGAGAKKLLAALSGQSSRTYDPDDDDGSGEPAADEPRAARRSWAERALGIVPEAG